jgi:argininosuccinate lyase
MPQKRNPDPFELVRAAAHAVASSYGAALGTLGGLALSYHRDLQETKRHVLEAISRGAAALNAFERALADTTFVRAACNARAGDAYVVATDLADALIFAGVSARDAHHHVGAVVRQAESQGRTLGPRDLVMLEGLAYVEHLDAPLDPLASVHAKATEGSTNPRAVRSSLDSLLAELATA